jgi:benzil reductase ((S)-benzoin forming)
VKTAIVTGVSQGLGEALAYNLLGRDFAVVGIARADNARLHRANYRFVACDLANAAAIDVRLTETFAAVAVAKPEAVYLINNAASAGPAGVLGQLDAEDLLTSFAVNLVAPVALANLFCKVFTDASVARRVLNVSSGAAQSAIAGGGAYSIAKAGLEMLTKQLTAEQTDATFAAITIRPGIIDTDMQIYMRSQQPDVLPSVAMFQGFHASGALVAPDVVAAKIVEKLILGDVERGRTYAYKDL